jgi:acetyl-CoA acetyltransferase
MHNPRGTYQNLPGTHAQGAAQFTAPYGFGGPGQGMAVAYTRWLERHGQSREKMATLAVTQRRRSHLNPHAYFYKVPLTREGLPEFPDGRVPVLPPRTSRATVSRSTTASPPR